MSSTATLRPQPPVGPLNPAGQQALAELLQAQASRRRLDERFQDAAKKLTEVAGQLNDRGTEQRLRYARQEARAEANGEVMDDDVRTEHEAFQAKVDNLTRKMDDGIRAVIDGQMWLENVPDALRSVARKTGAIAEATQQMTQGPTPITTQRNRGDDGAEMDDNDDAADEATQPPVPRAPDASETPTALLRTALEDQYSQWRSRSLTDRYADNNDYTGFYRTVYDAKNPGENAPPIPHASLWFAEEEGSESLAPMRSQRGRQGEEDEDSDVEIALERVSIKCPITLLPFRDPLTSQKCPHSFEKEPIMDMLHRTTDHLPLTATQQAEVDQITHAATRTRMINAISTPAVKCPVCSILLVEGDLKPDSILLRKTKRIEAAQRRKQDAVIESDEDQDEGDDDAPPGGTQRKPVGLGSSPVRRASGRAGMIKKERARSRSIIPQTQVLSSTPRTISAGGGTVVDLGEDDEEDED